MSAASEFEAEEGRRQARWAAVGIAARWIAGLIVAGVLVYLGFFREADDDRVRKALDSSGFQNPTLGGANRLACGDGETSRRFTATNPLGKRVEGTVCCGSTKGCTIRW